MLRVGLIGAGFIGATHADAIGKVEGVELVAVADTRRETANGLAGRYGARAYYEVQQLLADDEVDIVDICVPTYLHCQTVIAAARAGKHILCEKPVALTLGEVDQMIDAVDRSGVKSMVAQCVRFWPQYVGAKALLDKGHLGRPLMANAVRLAGPPSWSSWFRDPSFSGGAILDLHIHDLDYLYYLFGRPQQVCAVGSMSSSGAWDDVLTMLRYDGFGASARAGYRMPEGWPFTTSFRILGDEACVEYRFRVGGQIDNRDVARTEFLLFRPGLDPEEPPCPTRDAYEAEIAYFAECVAADRDPEIATLAEAREVLEIVLAAKESLQTGRAVDLE